MRVALLLTELFDGEALVVARAHAVALPHLSIDDSGLVGSTDQGGVLREQKMLKGQPPRVIYHQVY